METFSLLLAICVGNSPVTGEFPTQRPVTQSFDVFFDLRLNGRLSKQSWGWWFETPSPPLWRHSNDNICYRCRSWDACNRVYSATMLNKFSHFTLRIEIHTSDNFRIHLMNTIQAFKLQTVLRPATSPGASTWLIHKTTDHALTTPEHITKL